MRERNRPITAPHAQHCTNHRASCRHARPIAALHVRFHVVKSWPLWIGSGVCQTHAALRRCAVRFASGLKAVLVSDRGGVKLITLISNEWRAEWFFKKFTISGSHLWSNQLFCGVYVIRIRFRISQWLNCDLGNGRALLSNSQHWCHENVIKISFQS